MNAEKTEVKVTKIKKSPSQYYTPQNTQPAAERTTEEVVFDDIDAPEICEWVKLSQQTQEEPQQSRIARAAAVLQKETRRVLGGFIRFARSFAARMSRHFVRFAADRMKRLAASALACIVVLGSCTVTIFATCTLACRIKLGDKEIGTLPSEKVYYEILSDVKEEVLDAANVDFEPSGELSVNRVLISRGDYTAEEVVKEKLKSTSGEMIPAWAVVVDGHTSVALASQQTALDVLDRIKQVYAADDAEVTFSSPVKVENGFVPVQILKNADDAVEYLLSNDGPNLKVQTVAAMEGEEEIPYETEQRTDETQYEGEVSVVQEGGTGAKYVKYYSIRINGTEKEKKVISEEVLRQPVKRIEIVGTKERPSPFGTGEFAQPVSGTLTSDFGERWGRNHAGIDVGASVGTPIYAADNGTVVYSQYNDGGYGNLVQIDHGNGFVTYYGHCSELLVKVGDVVAKGDLIALVGNTGRSTGPHLHFEVRRNGEPQNPTDYLK